MQTYRDNQLQKLGDRFRGLLPGRFREEFAYLRWQGRMAQEYKGDSTALQSQEEMQAWLAAWDVDIELYRDPFLRVRTRHWIKKAGAKLVELPPDNDEEGYWETSHFWPLMKVLTDKGIHYVRTHIRQEDLLNKEMPFRVASLIMSALALLISIVVLVNQVNRAASP